MSPVNQKALYWRCGLYAVDKPDDLISVARKRRRREKEDASVLAVDEDPKENWLKC